VPETVPCQKPALFGIQKSQTVEALNVNISVSQSEKAIPAGFRHRNRAVLHLTDKRKRLLPDNAENLLIIKENLLTF